MNIPTELVTEATIQAEFYHQAKLIGLNCVMEFSTPCGRLDIAAFNDEWSAVIAIVEVKKGRLSLTQQIVRYKKIGVPVFGLNRVDKCRALATQIKRDYASGVFVNAIAEMPRSVRGWGHKKRKAFSALSLDEDVNYRQ